jgi:hypothetical protein
MDEWALATYWHACDQSCHQAKHFSNTSVEVEVLGDCNSSDDGFDLGNT